MENNKGKYLKYGLHAAILIGLIWAAVKYVNGAEVLEALQSFDYRYLPFMLALTLLYLAFKSWRFAILMSPFAENIPQRVVHLAYISGQAATLLPGGIAVRAGLMKQAGVPIAEGSVPVAVHSGWDQAVFLVGGMIAALWFTAARPTVLVILAVLGMVAVLLLVPQTRRWLANLAERIAARLHHEAQWQLFLDSIPKVFTSKIVLGCLLITLAALLFDLIILDLTLRGLGQTIPYPVLALAFILPTMLGRIVPIPGGVGVTEASMVGFLTAAAQTNTDLAVAAVAIYRVVTVVFLAAVGALVYFLFWRGEKEGQRPDEINQTKREAAHASHSDL